MFIKVLFVFCVPPISEAASSTFLTFMQIHDVKCLNQRRVILRGNDVMPLTK